MQCDRQAEARCDRPHDVLEQGRACLVVGEYEDLRTQCDLLGLVEYRP
jgi:hypothetical protein